jgi:hypothetical protein
VSRSGIDNTLEEILGAWVPQRKDALLTLYGEYETLITYLRRVFGEQEVPFVYIEWDNDIPEIRDADLIADRVETLTFPDDYKMDPRDPETAEWAKFATSRVAQTARGGFDEVTRFRSSDAVRHAINSGVPLSYFQAFDPPQLHAYIPVDAVVTAYEEGTPLEYARLAIYPG